MATITLYTKQACPFCVAAKQLLKSKGHTWTEIDVEKTPGAREEMIEKSGGRLTVPQIFIDSMHVGGFDDLSALNQAGTLDKLIVGK